MVRLVRSLVLSLREQPYVEAADALGAGFWRVVLRHILPNTLAPLIVQATYICASAVIFEAYLSFLGAGTPPEIPSWGNMMAEGRSNVAIAEQLVISEKAVVKHASQIYDRLGLNASSDDHRRVLAVNRFLSR